MTGERETASVRVLGLGNVLCGDDGAGIFALEELRRRHAWSEDVEFIDGGTLGLALLPTIESARSIIILDAILADAPPGSLITLEGASVEPVLRDRLSVHQIGVSDLLDALHWRGTWPGTVCVLGIVPERLDLRIGLSPGVAAGIDRLVDAAKTELRKMGQTPRIPNSSSDSSTVDTDEALVLFDRSRAARALGL